MIWRTEEGHAYSKLVEVYGRLVSSAGEEYRAACEARVILEYPRVDRMDCMRATARKRGGNDETARAAILERLQADVMREWSWRQEQKKKKDAVA